MIIEELDHFGSIKIKDLKMLVAYIDFKKV